MMDSKIQLKHLAGSGEEEIKPVNMLEKLVNRNRENPTGVSSFWLFVAEVLGVMETHCKKRHQQWQTVKPIQFDGTAIVECSRCPRQFLRK